MVQLVSKIIFKDKLLGFRKNNLMEEKNEKVNLYNNLTFNY